MMGQGQHPSHQGNNSNGQIVNPQLTDATTLTFTDLNHGQGVSWLSYRLNFVKNGSQAVNPIDPDIKNGGSAFWGAAPGTGCGDDDRGGDGRHRRTRRRRDRRLYRRSAALTHERNLSGREQNLDQPTSNLMVEAEPRAATGPPAIPFVLAVGVTGHRADMLPQEASTVCASGCARSCS